MNKYSLALRVNNDVNARVSYRYDSEAYGKPDFWEPAATFGDCEDYALEKRRLLLASGWPSESLGLVVCYINEQCHCCLWVGTDKGSFILDNNYADPMPPDTLPFKWESMLCDGEWRQLLGWR